MKARDGAKQLSGERVSWPGKAHRKSARGAGRVRWRAAVSHYTKLFSSLLDSTVWQAPDNVRLVWITMLAMKDRDGVVEASIPGLARRAGQTVQQTEDAVLALSLPDPYSRTKDHDGRRIAEVDGGWTVLNHHKYDEKSSAEESAARHAERQARYRARKSRDARVTSRDARVTPSDAALHPISLSVSLPVSVSVSDPDSAPLQKEELPVGLAPDPALLRLEPEAVKPNHQREIAEVVAYLNEKAAKSYRPTGANADFVRKRLRAGATVQECKLVIWHLVGRWKGDEKMDQYLRPSTIFVAGKWDERLDDARTDAREESLYVAGAAQ